jgi:hypothetical protein
VSGDYTVNRIDSTGMSLGDAPRFDKTVCFAVVHTDGTEVWRSSTYWASTAPRSIQGLRLGAARACKSYQAYLDRTGKRWEIEERERRTAERAAKKRADRLAWLKKNVPLLTAELAELEKGTT